ncbi:hypothetical protein A3F66_00195 [candidate division TM6 bacterium RIFCSPHIGHO2_12_FULL_32_22]|nr:MAG: hypothetical protein A3F66_00195 [candidate division TM6 bacterium RIFCSPHIGHO2_12_FULL_32_22]
MKKIAILILFSFGAIYAVGDGRSPREIVIEMEKSPDQFFPAHIDTKLAELGNDEAYIERLELRAKHPRLFVGYKPLPGQDVVNFVIEQHENIRNQRNRYDFAQLIQELKEIESAVNHKISRLKPVQNLTEFVKKELNKMLINILHIIDDAGAYYQTKLPAQTGDAAGPAEEAGKIYLDFSDLKYGVAEAIGHRHSMEDATAEVIAPDYAIFGLYDGHNGSDVSKFVADHLPGNITNHPEFQTNPEKALFDAYMKTDAEIPQDIENQGCTAVTALFKGNKLYVANTGDSRAVLSRDGRAIALSEDQSPEVPAERARIEALGGKVALTAEFEAAYPEGYPIDKAGKIKLFPYRVNKSLNMARALGDKKNRPFIIPNPEVKVIELKPEDEFLILACDGIWDYMEENQEAVNRVNIILSSGKDLNQSAEELIKYVNSKARGDLGHDNMSVIIVDLRKSIK